MPLSFGVNGLGCTIGSDDFDSRPGAEQTQAAAGGRLDHDRPHLSVFTRRRDEESALGPQVMETGRLVQRPGRKHPHHVGDALQQQLVDRQRRGELFGVVAEVVETVAAARCG